MTELERLRERVREDLANRDDSVIPETTRLSQEYARNGFGALLPHQIEDVIRSVAKELGFDIFRAP